MPAAAFTESAVEEAALAWLESLGYVVAHGPEIAPNGPGPERATFAEVVLAGRLRAAVARLNPDVPEAARDEAVRRVLQLDAPGLLQANRAFHGYLTKGVPVNVWEAGEERGATIRLVDFAEPGKNDWLAVNQFTITDSPHERRPDIVLFVNGLPLAVIELKNPIDPKADVETAYKQLQTYQDQIPRLFHYAELLVISDGLTTEVGTTGAPREHFAAWKTVDGETVGGGASLEVTIRGVFEQGRFLDLIASFIVFEDDGKLVKKVTRYHQFHAVQKAVQTALAAAGPEGSRRGGVLWHTQGSGKSLTMLFFAGKLVRETALRNPTIVMLTDRIDLDDQLYGTFALGEALLGQKPEQAANRTHLRELLRRGQGGVVFTTIQKFLPAPGEADQEPVLSERDNIIVMADEAHRTQYGFGGRFRETGAFAKGLAQHLRDALPNATFVAFTGTPLSLADRDTQVVFGNYIDVYDVERAIADKATVPIFYEARQIRLDLPEDQKDLLDEEFEELTEGEEEEEQRRHASRWSQQEAIVGTKSRIEQVAADFVAHYDARQAAIAGKVMIVAMSRRIAAKLYEELVRLRPEWGGATDETGALKAIMTGSATDDAELQPHIRSKERTRRLAERFKDPDDPFQIVIVRDMWLTGFDVPALHTIYIDKPMKGHGLMQAIARVNRVFRDKPGGLVVDYIGLADNLRAALRSYVVNPEDGESGRKPIENETLDLEQFVRAMLEYLERGREYFRGFDYTLFLSGANTDKLSVLANAQDHLYAVEGRERREKGQGWVNEHGLLTDRFIDDVTGLMRVFAIVSSRPEAQQHLKEIAFFATVKGLLQKVSGGGESRRAESLDQAIRQLVDAAIAPEGVIDIFAAAGLPKPDVGILSDAFLEEVRSLPQRNLALELLRKLINDEIAVQKRSSVVQARRFSERLEESLKRYHNRALEMAEIIDALIELAQEMNAANRRGEDLGLTTDEVAFYDALAANESARDLMGDPQLRLIAQEVAEIVRRNTTTDWSVRETARANLRRLVRRVLKKHGYPPDMAEAATALVIEQAELFGQGLAA